MEHAGLQGLARGPAEAGVRHTGVVPALAHSRASGRRPLPVTQLQLLVVDVQQADAAPKPDTDRGPLEHPATEMRGSGATGQRPELSVLSHNQLCHWRPSVSRGRESGLLPVPDPSFGPHKMDSQPTESGGGLG